MKNNGEGGIPIRYGFGEGSSPSRKGYGEGSAPAYNIGWGS